MKTTIGVFFGGRSVEHEISVISALQAIAALDAERYRAVPVYITKQGKWLTGPGLTDPAAYRDMAALERRATEVYMRPVLGERRLLTSRSGCFRRSVVATLDVVLPVLHGTGGEDGTFQGLMEMVGIPYVGCGVLSSALGMDKIAAKMVLRSAGLPTVEGVWFTDRQWSTRRDELVERIETSPGYPVIVKPANLGSSVGISRACDRSELVRAVGEASVYSQRLLVERMITPLREINCSVLGSPDDHITSVCEEPIHSGEILSYVDKYMPDRGTKGEAAGGFAKSGKAGLSGGALATGVKPFAAGPKSTSATGKVSAGMSSTRRRIPADLPEATATEIRRLASETFRTLGCNGVARVDFILEEGDSPRDAGGRNSGEVKIYVNEINAIPGSLSFYLWEATGVGFGELMDRLVAGALKRERDASHKTVSYKANIFNM